MTSGIYCIENIVNGKKYIGQGSNVEKRMWDSHRESIVLCYAFKKHGKENFKRYPIIYCEYDELDRLEIECIKIFNSHVSNKGYNVSWGGNTPMRGRTESKEHREKISRNNGRYWKGKHHSEEVNKKISVSKMGSVASDETKMKHSLTRSGRKQKNGITSKHVGVYKRNDCENKYRADFSFLGKRYHLGTFDTEEEAAIAYNEMYKLIRGTENGPNLI